MLQELSDFYLPKKIIHRDNQIKQIKEVFLNFKEYKCGTNLIIIGVTGSGKTTIIRKIIDEENSSIYVSGAETKTAYTTIKSIFNINMKNHSDVLNKTIIRLKEEPKILIFDEVDKIKNLKDFFNDLNTIYRKTMIPIIVVSLGRRILSSIPIDAKKTLFFEIITLPSYKASELKDILRDRLKEIKIKLPEINSGTISYISALAARQGSARVLLFLTLKCIQKGNFSNDFIDKVYVDIMKREWIGFVDEINEIEKEFLKHLIDSCNDEKPVDAETLQKKIGIYSQPRISQLLDVFEKYSIIKTTHKNLGRAGGRKRIINFISKEVYEEIEKIF